MISTCRRRYLGLWLLLAACSEDHRVSTSKSDGGTDAASVDEEEIDAAAEFIGCDDDTSQVPDSLVCTGLYASLKDKRVAKSAVEFVPAYPLWSDGAGKHRWIALPEGEKIDNTEPNDWVFPIGTKVWKEFRVGEKRIETRFYWKVRSDRWLRGTYAWNEDDSEAISSLGGDIQIKDGSTYHLPTGQECNDCHNGQPDRVLGFSAVNLGLEGASGVTLAQLAKDGLLTHKPALTELSIGADETGLDSDGVPLAAKVLATLHTNCGQTCHNNTAGAKANLTDQNLRLDSTLLDGRAPDEQFNMLRTTIGKRAEGVQWANHPYRILPGDPTNSLIYQLMSYRDPSGMGRGQMPPIATRKIDQASVMLLEKWISALAPAPVQTDAGAATDAGATMDAGAEDSGMDATVPVDTGSEPVDSGMDAGSDAELDAGSDAEIDAGIIDAGADLSDAGIDAGLDASDGGDPDASDADALDSADPGNTDPDADEQDPDM
jgi:hypothetical protein